MTSQGSAPSTSAVTVPGVSNSAEDLWVAAVSQLSESDQTEIQIQQKDKLTVISEAFLEAQQKSAQCVAREWKYTRRDGTKVAYRDLFNKIVSWIDKFKQVGDVAASFDPTHAAPAWAVVKVLLQVAIGDSQIYTAMLESLEAMTNLIAQYAVFEGLYLKQPSQARDLLKQSITKLYSSILAYLIKIKNYFLQNTAKKVVKGAFRLPGFVDDDLKKIRAEQAITEELARLIDAEVIRAKTLDFTQLRTMLTDIQQPLIDIKADLKKISNSHDREGELKLLAWISTIRYADHHELVRKDRLQNSGLWFMNHPSYMKWRQSSTSCVLWLHGIPGSGKSTLMSLVVDSLRENKLSKVGGCVAYAYCLRNPSESDRSEPEIIARSLLRQLACPTSSDPLNEVVKQKYETLTEDGFDPRSLTLDDCEEVMLEILQRRPATIVIDALDECVPERRYQLLGLFERLISSAGSPVKLIVSSRNHGEVSDRMMEQKALTIDTKENSGDIDLYIQMEVDRSIKQKGILKGNVTDTLRAFILERLKLGAQGMFLWVSLMIANLCNAERIQFESDAKEELEKLPQGLNELYEKICQRIRIAGSRARRLAEVSLRWLLCSQSSLKASEFVAFVSQDTAKSGEHTSISVVLEVCSNLVVHDTGLDVLRLTHLSVREYLETQSEFASNVAHATAAEICLSTLTSPEWMLPATTWSSSALYRYATLYTTTHLGRCEVQVRQKELASQIDHFFPRHGMLSDPSAKWMIQIVEAARTLGWLDPLKEMVKQMTGDTGNGSKTWVFVACIFGFPELVDAVCRSQSVVLKSVNTRGATTLHLASQYGHLEIAKMLTGINIDVDAKDEDSETALTLAAAAGHIQIVQHLLNSKAQQGQDGRKYGTPLQAASFHGHTQIVKLLSSGGDLEATGGRFGTALQAASLRGHQDVVRMLLDLGAEVNAPSQNVDTNDHSTNEDSRYHSSRLEHLSKELARLGVPQGRFPSKPMYAEIGIDQIQLADSVLDIHVPKCGLGSALQVACRGGHTTVVQLLLEYHADVTYEGGVYGHALQAAAIGGSTSVVNLLLSNGAYVSEQSGLYGCALQAACRRNHPTIATSLLDNGADVNLLGGYYCTPLQTAARTGNLDMTRTLLDHKAAVNAAGGQYHTALQAAAAYGFTEVVKELVARGADVNICGGQFHSALEAAAHYGSVDTVRFLFEQGANLFNALHIAALEGCLEVVRYLLRQDIDVNLRTRVFGMPLLCAISHRRDDVAEFLLDLQIDIHSENDFFGYPLQLAAARGNVNLVNRLLEKGADLTEVGSTRALYLFGTKTKALTDTQSHSSYEMDLDSNSVSDCVEVFSEHGTQSALESAAGAGQTEVVRMLLESISTTTRTVHPWRSIQQQVLLTRSSAINMSLLKAALSDHPAIISMLLHASENESGIFRAPAFWRACKNGDRDLIQSLLETYKYSIYDTDFDRYDYGIREDDILAIAIHNKHHHIVPLLLGSKIDEDVFGRTHQALEAACIANNQQLVHSLIAGGIDIDKVGRKVDRPLMLASASGNREIVKMLLNAGANPNFLSTQRTEWEASKSFLTALHAASSRGDIEVVKDLLSHGAAIDVQSDVWPTALFVACCKGHLDIVRLLIQRKANVNATETTSRGSSTALQTAISKGFHQIVELLLENKADVNKRGDKLGTALKIAAYHGHADILLALINAGADVTFTEEIDIHSNASSSELSNTVESRSAHTESQALGVDFAGWMPISAVGRSGSGSNSDYESALEELPIDPHRMDELDESSQDRNALITSDIDALEHPRTGGISINNREVWSPAYWRIMIYTNKSRESVILSQDQEYALITIAIQAATSDFEEIRSRTVWRSGRRFTGGRESEVFPMSDSGSDESLQFEQPSGSHEQVTSQDDKPGLFGSAIHAAACTGSIACVQLLISHGADLSHQDRYGQTPLHQAAFRGNLDTAREFLTRGVSVDVQDLDGRSALMLAAASGHHEVVEELLRYAPQLDIRERAGRTALFLSANYGHIKVLKLLLSHGAPIDIVDEGHRTPLHAAARKNHLKIVENLLAHGADVNSRDKCFETPLLHAIQKDNVRVARCLAQLDTGSELMRKGWTLLHDAAMYRSYRTVQWLLESGFDVDARSPVSDNEEGRKPAHLAVQSYVFDIVSSNVGVSATPDYTQKTEYYTAEGTEGGKTPLHLAINALYVTKDGKGNKNYHEPVDVNHDSHALFNTIAVLLSHGADPNIRSERGISPLSLAITEGYCAIVDTLVRAGSNVKIPDSGPPPIHRALRSKSCKVMKLVLDHGADVDGLDEDGRTALQRLQESDGFHNALADRPVMVLVHYQASESPAMARPEILRKMAAIRKDLKDESCRNFFFEKQGFDIDRPLYDLSDTPYDSLIHRSCYSSQKRRARPTAKIAKITKSNWMFS